MSKSKQAPKSEKSAPKAKAKSKGKALAALALVAAALAAGSFKAGEHQGLKSGQLAECNHNVGVFLNPQLSPTCEFAGNGNIEIVLTVPGVGEVRFDHNGNRISQ
jgi:hypothetical protein